MVELLTPPPHPPLPPVIGHRGAAARAPENTLASLRRAAADGAHWVEFDVQLTADGVPVLLHDADLRRTTDGSGALAQRSWSEIARLDAGGWFDARFRGERVPSLAQALDACAALGLGANLELKPAPGAADALAEAVARVCSERALARGWIWSSFDPAVLLAVARHAPRAARGCLCEGAPAGAAELARDLGCASVHAAAAALDAPSAAALRRHGATLLVYTVNDPARARELRGFGVASVFSDDPARMADA